MSLLLWLEEVYYRSSYDKLFLFVLEELGKVTLHWTRVSTGHLIDDVVSALHEGLSVAQQGDAVDKLYAALEGSRGKCFSVVH